MVHLKEFPAREAKNRFGELLDSAQRAPVRITKNGRNVAVLLAASDYRRLEEIEDAIWAARAKEVEKNAEFLSVEETEAFIKRFLSDDARS